MKVDKRKLIAWVVLFNIVFIVFTQSPTVLLVITIILIFPLMIAIFMWTVFKIDLFVEIPNRIRRMRR